MENRELIGQLSTLLSRLHEVMNLAREAGSLEGVVPSLFSHLRDRAEGIARMAYGTEFQGIADNLVSQSHAMVGKTIHHDTVSLEDVKQMACETQRILILLTV